MIRPALLSAIVLLAGCARSEEARYAQVENVQLPALNAADPAGGDELTIGTWQTGLQQDRPVLDFGPAGAPARFSIGCDDRRNLLLLWPGAAPGQSSSRLRRSSQLRLKRGVAPTGPNSSTG